MANTQMEAEIKRLCDALQATAGTEDQRQFFDHVGNYVVAQNKAIVELRQQVRELQKEFKSDLCL